MTEKAYIVANKEQELEILKKFEQKGLFWRLGRNATDFIPSENGAFNKFASFPYAFIENGFIIWSSIEQLKYEKIIYDGRKEDAEVDTKYKVTQEFMNELIEWRDDNGLETKTRYMYEAVDGDDIQRIPDIVDIWWTMPSDSIERNNRLIAIIQWLNGEDVFEVEEPHKFVVRSEKSDNYGDYIYIQVKNGIAATNRYYVSGATKFDTREEAQEWANSHQVVVEIDAEGNEVG